MQTVKFKHFAPNLCFSKLTDKLTVYNDYDILTNVQFESLNPLHCETVSYKWQETHGCHISIYKNALHIIFCKTMPIWFNVFLSVSMTWSWTNFPSQFRLEKITFSVTPLLGIISLQDFTHVMTAQLGCHVQNLIAITSLQLGWDQNVFFIQF